MPRPTVALLSTHNLIHNTRIIKEKVGHAKIVAMVKANGYGHGIEETALRLDQCVDLFGVASIDEAMQLRNANVRSPILLAQGIFTATELDTAAHHNCHVVFHHTQHIDWLMNSHLSAPVHAWIKVNTGLCRLGFPVETAHKVYTTLTQHPSIRSVTLMTHFACANDKMHPMNQHQIVRFHDYVKDKKAPLSMCNSAAVIQFPNLHYDYVRPGLALYGCSPVDGTSAKDLGLKPVMTLKTQLMSIQHLPKGSSIGYSARYQCNDAMTIGIAACGYGDGYPVSAQDGTPVLVNDIKCTVVGRVSMDMMAIDLTHNPSAKVGDNVTLWGDNLPIEDVAHYTSDITWRLLAGVSSRVTRVWIDAP